MHSVLHPSEKSLRIVLGGYDIHFPHTVLLLLAIDEHA